MPSPHSVHRVLASALLLALAPAFVAAEAVRYGGSLQEFGMPASGDYALRMGVYDAPQGGRRLGRELTLVDVAVRDGAFEAEVDFGLSLATLPRAWLQVEVAGSDGRFETLGAREALDTKGLPSGVCWETTGNSGTFAGTNFLGTLDLQPLDLRVNNSRALRLQPVASATFGSTPTITVGGPNNMAAGAGATVAGGGATLDGSGAACPTCANVASGNFATVSGGLGNTAGASGAVGGGQNNQADSLGTISGGNANRASDGGVVSGGSFNTTGVLAAVPGGSGNCAGGTHSLAAGHFAKVRGPMNGTLCLTGVGGTSDDADGDEGSFVWADSPGLSFATNGPDQFLVRARGGVGINRTPASAHTELTIQGRSSDAFLGSVDLVLLPSANGGSEEGIAIAAERGGAGTNDAVFTIAQRNNSLFVSRFRIDTDGTTRNTTGAWSTLSDARVKRGIEPIPSPLTTLLGLRGHRFEYTDAAPGMNDGQRLGFVAQEVREVLPQWVRLGSDGYYSVTPTGFEALAVEAMRELAEENVALHADNAALKRANAELQSAQDALARRLSRIEAHLGARGR